MARMRSRRDVTPEPWDGGEWVDVGDDGHWRPSMGERLRSLVVILAALGVLLVLAAVASVGGGGRDEVAEPATTTTAPTTVTTIPTTVLDPASLAGEPTPGACVDDARDAAPLRDRSATAILVLNGTPRSGQAGTYTDRLRKLDYQMSVPGNASVRSKTSVEYTPGHCAEAVVVALDLGIDGLEVTAIEPDSDVFLGRADVLVTLGRDSL